MSTWARSGTTLSETHGPKMARQPSVDELIKGPFDRKVGAVGQTDHVALHELDRPVDEPGRDRFVENQPKRIDGVVVGVALVG